MTLRYTFAQPAPFEHQRRALGKIARLDGRCALFMEMGTAKTRTAIDWAGIAFHNLGVRRVVIVCPPAAIGVWEAQIRQWCPVPSRVHVLRGPVKERIERVHDLLLFRMGRYDLSFDPRDQQLEWLITNYEGVWRGAKAGPRGGTVKLDDALKDWAPDLVIADEAHKLKSPSSRQSKALWKLGQAARMRLALTGTPVTKSPLDLYGQLRFVDEDILAQGGKPLSWSAFRDRYGVWGGFGGHELIGYRNLDELVERVQAHSFRIRKEECLDLPPRVGHLQDPLGPNVVPVEMPPKAWAIYRQMAKEMVVELESGAVSTAQIVVTKLMRLAQITSGFLKTTGGDIQQVHDERLSLGLDLIEDMVEQGEKVIVFCRFIHDYESLYAGLHSRKIWAALYVGNDRQKTEIVRRFQTDPGLPVFISQVSAGSMAIDLTAAAQVVFYSVDYRLDSYLQAIDRAHRQGQKRKVTYHHLAVPRTIDTITLDVLKGKGQLAHAVIHDPRLLLRGLDKAA